MRKVPVAIPFAGGVETKLDAKQVPPIKLLRCQNAVFTRGGTLAKRNGYEALPRRILGQSSDIPVGRALTRRGSELVALTEDKLYSYLSDETRWADGGNLQSIGVSHRVAAKTTTEQTLADSTKAGGVICYVWEDSSGGSWYSVTSESGKTLIRATQLDAAATRPRVVKCGDVLHVLYALAADNELRLLVINPTNVLAALTTSHVLLTKDLDGTDATYDLAETATEAVIAWHTDTDDVRVGYLAPSGVLGSPSTGYDSPITISTTVSTVGPCVAWDAGGTNQIAVAWWQGVGPGFTGRILASDLTIDTSLSVVANPSTPLNATIAFQTASLSGGTRQAWFWWEESAAVARDRIVRWKSIHAGTGSLGSQVTLRGAALASKGFADAGGDGAYVHVVHDTTLYATYLCVRTDGLIVARVLPGVAGGATTRPHLPAVQTDPDDARIHTWPAVYRVALQSAAGDVFTERGIQRVTYDFDSEQSHRAVQIGESLYVAGGGQLSLYDGDSVVEAMPHYAVDGTVSATPSADGGSVAAGTYLYRFTPEWTLANGELVVGPASSGTSVVVGGGGDDTVTLEVPTFRATAMTAPRGEMRIGVWRSEKDVATSLYRVSSLDPSATGANGYLANDPTGDTVTFIDKMADADLVAKEPLYTNGGLLNNAPVPVGEHLAVGKNRIWCSDPGDPLLVRYSQERRDGYAAEFADDLKIPIDPFGGGVTGLAVLDDALVVFKRSAIFFLAGPGPLADGVSGPGFSPPVLITTDVGCQNADSIVTTPLGLMFQSTKGIYLLGRDRQVTYVGAPVEAYNDQTITAATLIEGTTQVRFLASTGTTLLYDYFFDQWSEFSDHEGNGAAVVDGVYHYLRTNGDVYQETPGVHRDDTRQIRMQLITAWIKLQQTLQGWQRIFRALVLGTYRSPHSIRVRVGYDYAAGWRTSITKPSSDFINEIVYGDSATYGDDAVYGGANNTVYQFEMHLGEACEAVRFLFEDVEATADAGASFELTELLLVAGVKGAGYNQLEAARQA
jgi:hypothetical protein